MDLRRTLLVAGIFFAGAAAVRAQSEGQVTPRIWTQADYLMMWGKSQSAPPLVTTGPPSSIGPGGFPGTLGYPGTQTLIGGDLNPAGPFSGGRFILGGWIADGFGLEGSYLTVLRREASQFVEAPGTAGSTPLSLPFFNPAAGESTTGVASPGAFAGQAFAVASTRLQGAEALGIADLYRDPVRNFQAVLGYRWFDLNEDFAFTTSSPGVPPAAPNSFRTRDYFRTVNDFHGATLGLRGERNLGAFALKASAKVALGNMQETTEISGLTATNAFTGGGFAATQTFRGGYLAQPTNIGHYTLNRFAAIPEINLGASWQFRPNVRFNLGYDFIYMTSVTRPADQIDRTINPTQAPSFTAAPGATLVGPTRPSFLSNESDFWLHGVSLGIEFRF